MKHDFIAVDERFDRIESALKFIARGSFEDEEVEMILNPKKPLTLAQKFQEWRQECGTGKGNKYWEGLAKIAEDHYITSY